VLAVCLYFFSCAKFHSYLAVSQHCLNYSVGVIARAFFVGLIEVFHQSVHLNLLPAKSANIAIGLFLGGFFGTGFFAYRGFHLRHHVTTNTIDDPERVFYGGRVAKYGRLISLLLVPLFVLRYANAVNKSAIYFSPSEARKAWLDKVSIVLVGLMLVGLLVLHPVAWGKAFALPMMVFFFLEYFMAQSQHYGKEVLLVAPRGEQHYSAGINVYLPWWLSFVCLFTNLHAVHHSRPSLKWYEVWGRFKRDRIEGRAPRAMYPWQFFGMWFSSGPKVNHQAVVSESE
jgi:fatty acid desaturase